MSTLLTGVGEWVVVVVVVGGRWRGEGVGGVLL